MASRIVDPNRFVLLGAVTDWIAIFRRQPHHAPNPREIAKDRKLELTRLAQLRWVIAPELGYPTEPFKVWRRPAIPLQREDRIEATDIAFFGARLVTWRDPRVYVRVRFNATAAGSVSAFAGAPIVSTPVGNESFAAGFQEIAFSGAQIQCLVFNGTVSLVDLIGAPFGTADDPTWQLVERVALPVDESWSSVFDLGGPQGMEGSPVSPIEAARDRFRRGAPFYGWEDNIASGLPAPPWLLANPDEMIKLVQTDMLEPLKKMITTLPPERHHELEVKHGLPLSGTGDPATTRFHPMRSLAFGAITDPLASLISGFGTAFEDIDLPKTVIRDHVYLDDPTHSDWDFMVTARYSKGLDGRSEPVEYAAIARAPAVATLPPVPTNLAAATDGHHAPPTVDTAWHGVVRVSWDKIADHLPFRVGSYALARAQLTPAGGVEALMNKRRNDSALQPISATTSAEQEHTTGKLGALDERYEIATTPNPNALRYGVAHQDLFGLWSPWATTPHGIGEPPPQQVAILAARLDVDPADTGPCPAKLVIDLSWDWAARSLRRMELVGRLYAQAKRNDPPANLSLPAGLPTSLSGGPGVPFKIVFNGNAAGTPDGGNQIQYLSDDGKSFLPGPVNTAGTRRYRVTISGFNLDFASTGHIGLALWARGIEHRPPQREGAWSSQPLIASASDPRPPKLTLEIDNVLLASMPDAAGEHHAQLQWSSMTGAVGYFIYTTTESKLRTDHGLGDAPPSQTLSQRLSALRTAFAASPLRRSFTRYNDRPIAQTSAQVTLPRGSKEIHLYMILGVSAGQKESPWPQAGTTAGRRPIAYAAPQVATPAPPDLEVARVLDRSVDPPIYRARVRARTKPGAAVSRVDLYRVRVPEAALELDTMGPPVAKISGSTATWIVEPTPGNGSPAQTIGTITGTDAVDGSWKRVFYRAVAWGTEVPARGLYAGRSSPSAVREVIVPVSTPPDLSALASSSPGPVNDTLVTATTTVPVDITPLGPHRVRADVLVQHPDGTVAPFFSFPATAAGDNQLTSVSTTQPPAGLNGLWREAGSPGQTRLKLLLRRASLFDALKVRVMLIDPLGRATERTLDVPPAPLPAPDIVQPAVTKVPGKGFLLSFRTTVPVPPTPFGPYVLDVAFTPGGGNPARVSAALPDIPRPVAGEDIFLDPAVIPLRRAPGQGGTSQLGMALRGNSGRVAVRLRSPDGQVATLTRDLT